MNPKLLISVLVWGLLATGAAAAVVDRVAAVVNGEAITTFELELELRTAPPGTPRELALEKLIEDRLIGQRAVELEISVSDAELEEAIRDIQIQNRLTREQLVEALRADGVAFEDYRANVKGQILRFKLLAREVQSRTDVTSQEMREYFREHIDDFRSPPFVRLSQITVAIPARATPAQLEARRERAAELAARLAAGEDFTLVLLGAATDASVSGGEMGSFQAGELSPQFERAITGLETGGVSEVIETPIGFLLLRVDERSPGSIRHYDAVKEEIARRLKEQKTEQKLAEWKAGLRERAFIDIRL